MKMPSLNVCELWIFPCVYNLSKLGEYLLHQSHTLLKFQFLWREGTDESEEHWKILAGAMQSFPLTSSQKWMKCLNEFSSSNNSISMKQTLIMKNKIIKKKKAQESKTWQRSKDLKIEAYNGKYWATVKVAVTNIASNICSMQMIRALSMSFPEIYSQFLPLGYFGAAKGSLHISASWVPCSLASCLPLPRPLGERNEPGLSTRPRAAARMGWKGWCPRCSAGQSSGLGRAPHICAHPNSLPKEGVVEDGTGTPRSPFCHPLSKCYFMQLFQESCLVLWKLCGPPGATRWVLGLHQAPLATKCQVPGAAVPLQVLSVVQVGLSIIPCSWRARYLASTAHSMSQGRGRNKAWWRGSQKNIFVDLGRGSWEPSGTSPSPK